MRSARVAKNSSMYSSLALWVTVSLQACMLPRVWGMFMMSLEMKRVRKTMNPKKPCPPNCTVNGGVESSQQLGKGPLWPSKNAGW